VAIRPCLVKRFVSSLPRIAADLMEVLQTGLEKIEVVRQSGQGYAIPNKMPKAMKTVARFLRRAPRIWPFMSIWTASMPCISHPNL
jgi:hypothetical protein